MSFGRCQQFRRSETSEIGFLPVLIPIVTAAAAALKKKKTEKAVAYVPPPEPPKPELLKGKMPIVLIGLGIGAVIVGLFVLPKIFSKKGD
jgi:hypothetical protein